MANINDTNGARVVGGISFGWLGVQQRIKPSSGDLIYDTSETKRGRLLSRTRVSIGESYNKEMRQEENLITDKGKTVNLAVKFGLPEAIKGNPLGCSCDIAHLAGATPPVGSHIEADYMCDYGYHNYVYFELIGFENKGESKLKIDANGDLIEETKTEAKELEEF